MAKTRNQLYPPARNQTKSVETKKRTSSAHGKAKNSQPGKAKNSRPASMTSTGATEKTQVNNVEVTSRKRPHQELSQSQPGDGQSKWDIRYGATEVLAVYMGGDDYGFVALEDDVLFADKDEEAEVSVEWLEEDDNGVLHPAQEIDSVAIGALICAVTDKVIERIDGSLEVPDSVRQQVKQALELQLEDDYDPDAISDGTSHEERIQKRDEQLLKVFTRGTKPRVSGSKGRAPAGKRSKQDKTVPAVVVARKFVLTPRPDVMIEQDIWTRRGCASGGFSGDTNRCSKDVIRAIRSSDTELLKKLIADKQNVADLYIEQSCDMPYSAVHYAYTLEDKVAMQLLHAEKKEGQKERAAFPACSILEKTSGKHTSRYADYNRYNVAASRGGKEGNNAFIKDTHGGSYSQKSFPLQAGHSLALLFEQFDAISPDFLAFLERELFSNNLFNYSFPHQALIRSGHRELAEIALKALETKGVGLNSLHVAVLGAGATLEKVRAVSVIKKSDGNGFRGARYCPIHCAAINSNPTYMQQLLQAAPDALHMLDGHEAGVLHYAAVADGPETLKWLLEGPGAFLPREQRTRRPKETPLMWGARAARGANVALLLADRSDDERSKMNTALNADGLTAMHLAVSTFRKGRLDAVRALLDGGAAVDVRSDARLQNKLTPSMIAAQRGDLEMLELLVERGANLMAVDKLNRSLAMLAARNGQLHVLSYLARAGVNLNAEDSSQNTAMHYAAGYGWVECLELLLANGANPDQPNNWASTPLSLSIKKGCFACAAVLLQLTDKVDVNVRDKTGRSLFSSLVGTYLSMLQANPGATVVPWAITQMLQRQDLDLCSVDSRKRSLLHYVAESPASTSTVVLDLVKQLLQRGLDPLLRDEEGKVAAEIAISKLPSTTGKVQTARSSRNLEQPASSSRNLALAQCLLEHVSHSDLPASNSTLLHRLMEGIGEIADEHLFTALHHRMGDTWSGAVDARGRTPLLVAADVLCAKKLGGDLQGWARAKRLFEGVLDKMSLQATNVLDRKKEFASWKQVDKRLREKEGKVDWVPADEYDAEAKSFTLFHALCAMDDVAWALSMCRKLRTIIIDDDAVKRLVNLKAPNGDTPVLLVLRKIHLSTEECKIDAALSLLELLQDAGADMNGVRSPLFISAQDAIQNDHMDVTLDTTVGSDDEKLHNVREYVMQRERGRVKEHLAKHEASPEQQASLQPYLHLLLQFNPPLRVLKEVILRLGMLPDRTDLAGNTALHVAAKESTNLVVATVLEHTDADVNAVNKDGDSALILAAGCGQHHSVRALLDKGALVDYVCPGRGTALHRAVRAGHNDVVSLLLERKCSLEERDEEQRTALHYAIANSALSTRQVLNPIEMQLLKAGSNINAPDSYGRTPPFYAFVEVDLDMKVDFPAKARNHDPIDLLSTMAAFDVRFDIADADGRTLLHLASAVGGSVCVLSLTESAPALLSAVDMDKNTPLAVALLAERWDTALILISKGSDLDVEVTKVARKWEEQEQEGAAELTGSKELLLLETARSTQSTLWHALQSTGALATYMLSAARLPMDVVLSALLRNGSFQKALQQIQRCRDASLVCARSQRDGMTALHRLAQAPSFANAPGFALALAKALIGCGVCVDDVCSKGWSVVHIAAFHGHVELIKGLIGVCSATVDVKDKENNTPIASMFLGRSPSVEVLCALLDASKDAPAMANNTFQGFRSHQAEKDLLKLLDAEARLFDTAPSAMRSKEAFVTRLVAAANKKKSTQVASCVPADAYRVRSTPLIEAVRSGACKRTVNALLSYDADIHATDQDGRTALHHAALSTNIDVLHLLLRWSTTAAVNVVDKHGYSVLAYATCKFLDTDSKAVSEILNLGADPQCGGALLLAIKHNKAEIARMMLSGVTTTVQPQLAPPPCVPNHLGGSTALIHNVGDRVWVRLAGAGRGWDLVKVVHVDDNQLSVVPADCVHSVTSEHERRWHAVSKVPSFWVRAVDELVDVPTDSASDLLVQCFKACNSMSEADRRQLLKRRAGAESTLMELLEPGSSVAQTLLSPLHVGDAVGIFCDQRMVIGSIAAVHANGLYDVQVAGGALSTNKKRMELRPLRKELQLEISKSDRELDSNLVHVCVRPFNFSSYENINLLRALARAGATLDAKDAAGRTPLDLARPGSAMQRFLQEATGKTAGRPLPPPPAAHNWAHPTIGSIDLAADANAALKALHDQGADVTERVVPTVNPVCELDSEGVRVVFDGEHDWFDVALSKVDVAHGRFGKYVFYKMQLLFDPVQDLYVLLTNWGRIGESGKFQQTPFSSLDEGAKEFAKVFKSKTANAWVDRHAFVRKAGKYALVKTMRTRVKHPEKLLSAVVERPSLTCTLDSSLAETMRGLLSVEPLMAAFRSSGLDQSKLPLGQLSMETLDAAEAKLKEISALLENRPQAKSSDDLRASLEKVAELSSEYYELLPIGDQIVKPFEQNDKRFGNAVELIRLLRDLSVTKQMLLGAMQHQAHLNPIEYAYSALQIDIKPLDAGSTESACVQRMIDSTCESNVLVNQIFALDDARAPSDIDNKRLLFHGSKSPNVLGILKQGLRIAPPEAPVSGYMYGKGVYFADHFAKALSYTSGMDEQKPRAYVFVAEVALGEQHTALQAEYMESAQEGTQSTFAPGEKQPDPNLSVTLDQSGVSVALGAVCRGQLREEALYEWSTGSWNQLAASESKKIEAARADPTTKFPVTIRITHRSSPYDVRLEGPLAAETTARKVQQQAMETDAPDMSAFVVQARSGDFSLTRQRRKQPSKPHSEFIVYDTSQIRLKYLIEVTTPAAVEVEWKRTQQQQRANEAA